MPETAENKGFFKKSFVRGARFLVLTSYIFTCYVLRWESMHLNRIEVIKNVSFSF